MKEVEINNINEEIDFHFVEAISGEENYHFNIFLLYNRAQRKAKIHVKQNRILFFNSLSKNNHVLVG
jgi:hypothetical protein